MAKKWRCTVCGYIHEGPEAPDQCPMCKVGKEKFVEVVEQEEGLTFVTEHVIGAKVRRRSFGRDFRITSWANAPRWACIWR